MSRTENLYTAGPWVVEGPDDEPYGDIEVRQGKWRTICRLMQDDAPVPDYNAEQWANARLIAAAPDLLSACNGGLGAQPNAFAFNLDYFAAIIEQHVPESDGWQVSHQCMIAVMRKYAEVLRTAILKATTGSEASTS